MDLRGNTSYPLGLRNNNPGNLRPGDNWQGMVGVNNNFIVFSNITYGIRALGTDVSNKYFKGLDTITKIISVYAPPSENNTTAYINAVAASTGIGANSKITLTKDVLFRLIRAIITHENGAQYAAIIPDSEVQKGIDAMSSTILLRIKGFFAAHPEVTSAATGVGILAAITIVIIILIRYKLIPNDVQRL